MLAGGLGLNLLALPETRGGLGAGAFDRYRVAEVIAGIDLAVATSALASFLAVDLIGCAATDRQRDLWWGRIADEGMITAFCASEPEAGSDLAALRSRAIHIEQGDRAAAYRIDAAKQWISNGGVADLYLVLARAPAGPSWFLVEAGAAGLSRGRAEQKHGVRASNTTSIFLADVVVAHDRLLGGVEGAGLAQAAEVFSRARLVAAACGLGAGWASLDRALRYSRNRIVGGEPLAHKPGYTHKLIVPHAVRLEAGRAFLEETAARHDGGETDLGTEGAIAKYLCTEAGNLAADAALQALGANGYSREYHVEKIRRDVRVTTIYEGTSEVLEDSIGRGRWKSHLRTDGDHYLEQAADLEASGARRDDSGAEIVALALRSLAAFLGEARRRRLTRHGHLWLRLGALIARVEGAASLARQTVRHGEGFRPRKSGARLAGPALAAASRLCAREAALRVATEGSRWLADDDGVAVKLGHAAIHRAQAGGIDDLRLLAARLYEDPRRSGA